MDMAARTGTGSTPLKSIRIPDPRWARAMRAAKARGEDVSKAVNRFLDEYADETEKPKRTTKAGKR